MLKGSVMIVVPYLAADVGSIGGGYLSGFLMNRGWTVGRARLTSPWGSSRRACQQPSSCCLPTQNFVVALACISLATASHQAWSANIFTLPADMFPKQRGRRFARRPGRYGRGDRRNVHAARRRRTSSGHEDVVAPLRPRRCSCGTLGKLLGYLVVHRARLQTRRRGCWPTRRSEQGSPQAGLGVTAGGAILIGIVAHFGDCGTRRSVRNLSVSAQGLTAAIEVMLHKFALLYAS